MRSLLPHCRRVLPALALAALALGGVASCGGDDELQATTSETGPAPARASGGDEALIRAVIEESFRTRDPAACARIATQRFLEQVTFKQGAAARRECARTTAHTAPSRSVAITQIDIDGTTASARAVPEGGDADGQDVRLALVKRDAGWRLDRMTALRIERAPFDAAMRRALVREPDAMTAEQADCVVQRLGSVGDAELARAFVDSSRSVLFRATISCARDVFETTIREELGKSRRKLTAAQVECVISGLRGRISDAELQAVLESSDPQSAPPKALTDALGALLGECTSNATIT